MSHPFLAYLPPAARERGGLQRVGTQVTGRPDSPPVWRLSERWHSEKWVGDLMRPRVGGGASLVGAEGCLHVPGEGASVGAVEASFLTESRPVLSK